MRKGYVNKNWPSINRGRLYAETLHFLFINVKIFSKTNHEKYMPLIHSAGKLKICSKQQFHYSSASSFSLYKNSLLDDLTKAVKIREGPEIS